MNAAALPLATRGAPAVELHRRWRNVPAVSLEDLRQDLDDIIDPA